jgi:hypothetical protein
VQDKKIEYFEKTQQEGKVKQCFFFDPDGMFQSVYDSLMLLSDLLLSDMKLVQSPESQKSWDLKNQDGDKEANSLQ